MISGSLLSQSNCVMVTKEELRYSWNSQRALFLEPAPYNSDPLPHAYHVPMGLLSHIPCHFCQPTSGSSLGGIAVSPSP